jgi:DeoR/GlpR family transcriptional regulator of sugar metabolism
MLAPQRHAVILDLIRRRGGVRIRELVSELGVSDMTVRRDLEALADRGLIAKVHGGATVLGPASTDEPGFAAKATRQRAEKAAIAARAAQLVKPDTAIALSAGTTTAVLAERLLDVPGITVVTNSIPVADLFYRSGRNDQTVVLTGGVRTPSDALAGPFAEHIVRLVNVDMLFLGVHGMSARVGFTTPNLFEAETDRLLVAAARRLVVLADHTKWETIGVATIARLEEADVLITDAGLPAAAIEMLTGRVGELVVVDVPGYS